MAASSADEHRARLLLVLTAGMTAQEEEMRRDGGGGGGGIPGLGFLAAAGSLLRLKKRGGLVQFDSSSPESEEDATWQAGSRRAAPQQRGRSEEDDDDTKAQSDSTAIQSSTSLRRREGHRCNQDGDSGEGYLLNEFGVEEEEEEIVVDAGEGEEAAAGGLEREHEGQGFRKRRATRERGMLEAGGRALREGSTVCFYTTDGERLTVVQNGKFWELQPCGGEQEQGSTGAEDGSRVQYYNPKCLFMVRRRDKNIIFQSLGAEGRSLQALSGSIPHRCTNHNLGPWESWEPTSQGLMNVKWPNKALGYEIREVSCVASDDLRKIELGQLRTSKIVQQQIRTAEERVLESERKRKDVIRANQRQATLHQKEIDEIRSRLEETQQQKQRQEVESLRMSASQQQLELRIAELAKEKEVLDSQFQSSQTCVDALKRDLHLEKERHVIAVREVERSFEGEVRTLRKERDLDLQRAKDFTEKQQKQVHDELQQREHQRAILVQRLTSEHKNALKVKDAEIRQLVKECHRLMSILKRIKNQMEDAQQARQNYEAAQAAPPSWGSWQRRGPGFVPVHSASSAVQNDPALYSSGGSQMEYPMRGSPGPGSMPGMPIEPANSLPGYPNYRNPRSSPSAVSGDWMELSASKTIVEEWMEKGRGQADGLFVKQVSSTGSAGGVERTSSENMEPCTDRLPKTGKESPEISSDEKDVAKARKSPTLEVVKGFGSITNAAESIPKGKWEAAQELTVTTPPLDNEESNPPRSPEATDGVEKVMFSTPEAVAVP